MAVTGLHGASALSEIADNPKPEDLLVEPSRAGHVGDVQRGFQDSLTARMHAASPSLPDPSGTSASRSSWYWPAMPGRPHGSRIPHLPPASCGCGDRKSTRLNSSHLVISYDVFC